MNKDPCQYRVLMLVENNGYPEDTRIFHEATTLAEAGYLVSVICQSKPNRPWHEKVGEISVYRYPALISGRGFITYVWEYSYSLFAMFFLSIIVFLKSGFDCIHAANPPDTAFFIAIFYKIFRKRFIFDHHDLSPEIFQLKFGVTKKVHTLVYKILITLEKLSCNFADQIIATNQSYKEIEMERDGISADRITIVRNGPDADRIRLVEPDLELSGRAKTVFAYLGNMAKQDGVDHLLRALHHLDQRFGYSDWFCVLIGTADDQQGLQSLAVELGLEKRIWFMGYQPLERWISLLSAADICVEPAPANSLNKLSTMNKLMDYMSMGKPCVAYDLPEHRITTGEAALYAQPNDEVDMARQFVRLIDDSELCNRLGELGRRRIIEKLAWSYQKESLLTIYKRLLQKS